VTEAGLVVVDKPAGVTSHDVVGRCRRIFGTRKVGHAGTLDPMATGVLVIGVGRATRLLTYVIGAGKSYTATVRLGQATVTDDAEGDVIATTPAGQLTDEAVRAAFAALAGEVDQVPSAVSAIKIDGRRAYKRVRAGEQVVLAARRVTVSKLDILAVRRTPGFVDVDVDISCSSGTYVRAIARDLGVALGVGGHLTALRRTAVGGYPLAEAVTLDELESRAGGDVVTLTLADAASRSFPRREATTDEARVLAHGGPLAAAGIAGPYAVFAPDGALLAIVSEREGRARPEVVFAG
jgi:tRNA pseudouridine55 synthase